MLSRRHCTSTLSRRRLTLLGSPGYPWRSISSLHRPASGGLSMKCPRCQAPNREGVRFCEDCGARLDRLERYNRRLQLMGAV
ncbi:MAG: zinc-ribbon domain-containing protein, partial [Candidatus Methylomirabilia bacterium]